MTGFLRKIPVVSAFVPPKQPSVPERAQPSISDIDPRAVSATEAEKKAAQTAAAEKRRKVRGQSGRSSTQRTGALGATVPVGNIARKTLLGA